MTEMLVVITKLVVEVARSMRYSVVSAMPVGSLFRYRRLLLSESRQ